MNIRFDGIGSYADFKIVIEAVAFKGDVFYWNNVNGASSSFYVTAVDYARTYVASWMVSGNNDQKPVSFDSDFPNAVQVFSNPLTIG